jgi:hypothetical protein
MLIVHFGLLFACVGTTVAAEAYDRVDCHLQVAILEEVVVVVFIDVAIDIRRCGRDI